MKPPHPVAYLRAHPHLLLVIGVVAFNLILLWPETSPPHYLNDTSIHASMTRWAAARIRDGHLPLDGWYPYLSLGASRFHHYQALPAIVTGALSVPLGPGTFAWSGYLLLATWPIAVFSGARLFRIDPWPAAIAALVSPLVVSAPGLGYELNSYLWRGSGVWTQLWGMWLLPFAWALTWRAIARGRSLALGAVVLGITICAHLLTGYLALLTLGVWVLIAPSAWRTRLWRAAVVGAGALAVAAWMLVPVVTESAWVTQDIYSRNTLYYDSFGAKKVLGWLVTGGIFDRGRLPVLTVLVLTGCVLALKRSRRDEPMRAVLGVGGLSLLLFFGRPTLGPLLELLPGSEDMFLRRFVFGVQLAGLFLAGVGGFWLVGGVRRALARAAPKLRPVTATVVLVAIGALFLTPAIAERIRFVAGDATLMAAQRAIDQTEGADFAALVGAAQAEGRSGADAAPPGAGRIFAGSRAGGGPRFDIGEVPAYAALLNLDANGIGFTRPTWSLLSGAESRFDTDDPAQYDLFDIRWIILPEGADPPVPATQVTQQGGFVLWRRDGTSMQVVDTIAPIQADRTNLARQTASIMASDLVVRATLPLIAFAGRDAAAPTLDGTSDASGPPGSTVDGVVSPNDGVFVSDVSAARDAVVVLKQSFDPRWRATVDGEPAELQMVAPGMPGVQVAPGDHEVSFTYEPYGPYLPLFALAAIATIALVAIDRRARRRRERSA